MAVRKVMIARIRKIQQVMLPQKAVIHFKIVTAVIAGTASIFPMILNNSIKF